MFKKIFSLLLMGFLLFVSVNISNAQDSNSCDSKCKTIDQKKEGVCFKGSPPTSTNCMDLGFSVCMVPQDSGVSCWCCTPPPEPTLPQPKGIAIPRYGGGSNYPFPCAAYAPDYAYNNEDEFHSLRPYQASPCNSNLSDIALFCGNDIYVGDEVTISKNFSSTTPHDLTQDTYSDGTNIIFPNPPKDYISTNTCQTCSSTKQFWCENTGVSPCIPEYICNPGYDSNNCGYCQQIIDADGYSRSEMCAFNIINEKSVNVDMTESDFPIMGYTEPSKDNQNLAKPKVTNSIYTAENEETLTHADKMNEYVSWYLNGVLGRAEYPYWDPGIQCIGESTGKIGSCLKTRIHGLTGDLQCLANLPFPLSLTSAEIGLPNYYADGKGSCTGETYCCLPFVLSKYPIGIPGERLVIDYSGPVKKLLPFSIQNTEKNEEIDKGYNSTKGSGERHNQVVGCAYNFPNITILGFNTALIGKGIPAECYRGWKFEDFNLANIFKNSDEFLQYIVNETFKSRFRLTDFYTNKPPIEEDYLDQNFKYFAVDYKSWRGMTCFQLRLPIPLIDGFNLCFNVSLDNPAVYGNLFPYVPMFSTEDRLGQVNVRRGKITPYSSTVNIISSKVTSTGPIYMFVPHMEETVDLAELLQKTFASKDAKLDTITSKPALEKSPYCSYKQVRTNPGDDLFSGDTSATINYTAEVKCTFLRWGGDQNTPYGNLCENLVQGKCVDSASSCKTNYGQYDCERSTQICGVDCDQLPAGPGVTCYNDVDPIMGPLNTCVPTSSTGSNCVINPNYTCGSADYKCVYKFINGANYNCTPAVTTPPMTQECKQTILAGMKVETKTPLADKAWAKLVAGSAGIFRKMFPKSGENAPITGLADIPASTKAVYTNTSDDGGPLYAGAPNSGSGGTNAKIYFPHIGGIKEYFLNGIQGLLRPQGFGKSTLYSSKETVVSINPDAKCDGQLFKNYAPPNSTTSKASNYFDSYIKPQIEKYPELISVYATAESVTGVPCEVLAAIHCAEGFCNPDRSLISGRIIGTPEPDANNQVFTSLLETAIYAGEHLKSKSQGDIADWAEMITAVSWYNGGGNANCQDNRCVDTYPTYYSGPCPPPIGLDDPYATAWIDGSHLNMYLRFCADLTCCGTPITYTHPGVLTYAIDFFISGILNP